ncbi:hypothetical protein CGCSCA5_v008697 [Colletotrichum siamense]|nr:hypothetical protein CGCSCA5_v008697 [Colletotrichum siamense]
MPSTYSSAVMSRRGKQIPRGQSTQARTTLR